MAFLVKPDYKQLKTFFDFSDDLFCIASVDGFFKYINTSWKKTLGFTEEELMTEHFLYYVHRDDKSLTIKNINELQIGGSLVLFRNRFRTKRNGYITLSWNVKRIGDLYYCLARDVTELIRSKQALFESEQSLANVINCIDEMILVIGCGGKIQKFFPASFFNYPHYSNDFFIGKHYKNFFPKHVSRRLAKVINSIREDRESKSFDFQMDYGMKKLWCNARIGSIYDENGKLSASIVVLHDITQRKKNEQKLKEQNIDLLNLNKYMIQKELENISLREENEILKKRMAFERSTVLVGKKQ